MRSPLALGILALFAVFGLVHWGIALIHPQDGDFALAYTYCRAVLVAGPGHAYDPAALMAQRVVVRPTEWFLNVYTPAQILLTIPFATLPLAPASLLWGVVEAAAVLSAWWFLTPPDSLLERLSWLLLAAGFLPLASALQLGQVVPLVALAVVASWRLAGAGRPYWAGVALAALAIKPQLGLLLPLTLAASGAWRLLGGFAIGLISIGLSCVLVFGTGAITAWLGNLAYAAAHPDEFAVAPGGYLAALTGTGGALWVVRTAIVAATALVAYQCRQLGAGAPFVMGLVGSLLVSPFSHVPDQVMLLVSGAIGLRLDPRAKRRLLAFALYAGAQLSVALTLPLTLASLAWLVSWFSATSKRTAEVAARTP